MAETKPAMFLKQPPRVMGRDVMTNPFTSSSFKQDTSRPDTDDYRALLERILQNSVETKQQMVTVYKEQAVANKALLNQIQLLNKTLKAKYASDKVEQRKEELNRRDTLKQNTSLAKALQNLSKGKSTKSATSMNTKKTSSLLKGLLDTIFPGSSGIVKPFIEGIGKVVGWLAGATALPMFFFGKKLGGALMKYGKSLVDILKIAVKGGKGGTTPTKVGTSAAKVAGKGAVVGFKTPSIATKLLTAQKALALQDFSSRSAWQTDHAHKVYIDKLAETHGNQKLALSAARKVEERELGALAKAGAKRTATKGMAKGVGKVGATTAKVLGKKLPLGLGLAVGAGLAGARMAEGDTFGGMLEMASGVASVVPIFGTIASLGIDAGIIMRDLYKEKQAFEGKDGDGLFGTIKKWWQKFIDWFNGTWLGKLINKESGGNSTGNSSLPNPTVTVNGKTMKVNEAIRQGIYMSTFADRPKNMSTWADKPKYSSTLADKPSVANKIIAEAKRQGVDPNLMLAMAQNESGFKQSAISNKGALGVFQLMPETAKELGVNPKNEDENIRGGVTYMKKLLKQYGGNTELALAAYNAGMGRVAKYGGIPPFKETQSYVKNIMANYQKSKSLEGQYADISKIGLAGKLVLRAKEDPRIAAQNIDRLKYLDNFLTGQGYEVLYTATTGGKHTTGSGHYKGNKVDFQVKKNGVMTQLNANEVAMLQQQGYFGTMGAKGWEKAKPGQHFGHYDANVAKTASSQVADAVATIGGLANTALEDAGKWALEKTKGTPLEGLAQGLANFGISLANIFEDVPTKYTTENEKATFWDAYKRMGEQGSGAQQYETAVEYNEQRQLKGLPAIADEYGVAPMNPEKWNATAQASMPTVDLNSLSLLQIIMTQQ